MAGVIVQGGVRPAGHDARGLDVVGGFRALWEAPTTACRFPVAQSC